MRYFLLIIVLIFLITPAQILGQTTEKKIEYVELIKNGNFDAGLDNWRAKPNEINCKIGAFWIESCDKQEEYAYGFPKSSVSDALSVGERYFVTQVPSFSEKGWFDSTWQVVTASALEQDIDVPNAEDISLSFKARGYSDTQLEIYVKNRDDGTRTLFNQLIVNNNRYSFGDYIHRTYDMTSFAGKKITLIFASKQIAIPEVGAEDLKTAVYLDDISLIAKIPVTPVNLSYDESMWLLIVLPIIGIAITLTAIKASRKRHVMIQTPLEIPQKEVLQQQKFQSEKISDEKILVSGEQVTKDLQQKEHIQGKTPKAFISHGGFDPEITNTLKNILVDADIECYVAEHDEDLGGSLPGKLKKAIDERDIFIVIVTQKSASSASVNQEIGYAVNGRKIIILLIERGVKVPLLLQGIEYVEFSLDDLDAACQRIIKFILAKFGKSYSEYLEKIKNKKSKLTQSSYTDKDYREAIEDSLELKSLWVLYNKPQKYQTRNQLYKSFNEDADRSKTFYKTFEELIELGLINKVDEKQYIDKNKETFKIELTRSGFQLIRRARKEKIITWQKFLERFKNELEKPNGP